MAQQGYSIGRDTTVAVILADGTALRLGKMTSFDAKPLVSETTVKALDGINDHLRFLEGWNLTMELERRSADLDAYWAGIEANYYAGISDAPCTIQQTIAEPDGSVTQWRYQSCMLKFDDPGRWSADSTVKQALSAVASQRIKQA
jgi:hypothetical protein